MPQKSILVPARLRRLPQTGWCWVDRGFVREHAAHLSRDTVSLYCLLCAVADKQGLSFYADVSLAAMLRVGLPALTSARNKLLARDLIGHETHFTQVLSLGPVSQHRRYEPGQELMELSRVLRRVGALPAASQERSEK